MGGKNPLLIHFIVYMEYTWHGYHSPVLFSIFRGVHDIITSIKEGFLSLLGNIVDFILEIFSSMNVLDIFVVGLLFFCIFVSTCVLSGYKERIIKIEKENIPILVPLVSISISYFIFRTSDLFHTHRDSARYMLSALVQSEAAIIAIVITMSLVAVQLTASSYSPRVTKIFRNSHGFWILVGSYIFAMLYTLCVLKMIESDLLHMETHIAICYFIGIFCLTALIPYIWNMFAVLRTSKIIKILSQKITKESFNNERDPIQPIIDLVRGCIMKHDYETAREGIVEVMERAIFMFKMEDMAAAETRKISKKVCNHFSAIGKLTVEGGDRDLALEVISNVKKMGEFAAEKGLREISSETVLCLGEVGITAVKEDFEELAFETAFYLGEIGRTAVEKDFKEIKFETAFYLGEIGIKSVKKNFEEVTREIVPILGRIGIEAIQKDFGDVVFGIMPILGRIGIEAIQKDFGDVVFGIVSSFKEIGIEAIQKDAGDIAREIVPVLRRIGIEAIQKDFEEVAREIVPVLRRIGIEAIQKDFEEVAFETAFYLGEIGRTAVEKDFEKTARDVVLVLREIGISAAKKEVGKAIQLVVSSLGEVGMAAIEKKNDEVSQVIQLVVSSLGEVGMAALERDSMEEAWEVVLVLKAVEENLRSEKRGVVSILEKIAEISEKKEYKNLTLEIEQYLVEIKEPSDPG